MGHIMSVIRSTLTIRVPRGRILFRNRQAFITLIPLVLAQATVGSNALVYLSILYSGAGE